MFYHSLHFLISIAWSSISFREEHFSSVFFVSTAKECFNLLFDQVKGRFVSARFKWVFVLSVI